jgi:hypothetical protein
MKWTAGRVALVTAGGVVVGLALLGLLLTGLDGRTAQANPSLSVGVDAEPSFYPANGDAFVGTVEPCASRTSTGGTFEVDIYVKDVSRLMSFGVWFEYDPAIVHVTARNVKRFLLVGSTLDDVKDISDCPPASGYCVLSAFDLKKATHTGNGVLATLTLEPQGPAEISWANLTNIQLTDLDGHAIGDSNQDGYYDGPVANAEVGIDQPSSYCVLDSDYDGVINSLDQCPSTPLGQQVDAFGCSQSQVDPDLDGFCSPGAPPGTTWCSGTDNCPTISNPSQTNTDAQDQDNDGRLDEDPPDPNRVDDDADTVADEDPPGDGAGDACDPDDDGDGFTDADEVARSSNPLVATSTPEVCDGLDNDGDTLVDEGYNYRGNSTPDCTEAGLDTDGDGVANPSDSDDDTDGNPDPDFNDGFADTMENWMGTDSLDACPENANDPAWPADLTGDTWCDVADILMFRPNIMTTFGDPPFIRRNDLTADGWIDVADVLMLRPHIMNQCVD